MIVSLSIIKLKPINEVNLIQKIVNKLKLILKS